MPFKKKKNRHSQELPTRSIYRGHQLHKSCQSDNVFEVPSPANEGAEKECYDIEAEEGRAKGLLSQSGQSQPQPLIENTGLFHPFQIPLQAHCQNQCRTELSLQRRQATAPTKKARITHSRAKDAMKPREK